MRHLHAPVLLPVFFYLACSCLHSSVLYCVGACLCRSVRSPPAVACFGCPSSCAAFSCFVYCRCAWAMKILCSPAAAFTVWLKCAGSHVVSHHFAIISSQSDPIFGCEILWKQRRAYRRRALPFIVGHGELLLLFSSRKQNDRSRCRVLRPLLTHLSIPVRIVCEDLASTIFPFRPL